MRDNPKKAREMHTERRSALRKAVGADIIIDHQPTGLARGRIANVSVGGLYVRTGSGTPSPRAQVELVLMHQTESGTRVYRLPTRVVRTTRDGVGLAVQHYDLDTFRTLTALLLSTQSATAADDNPGADQQRPAPVLAGTAGTAEVAVARVVPVSPNVSPHPSDFD